MDTRAAIEDLHRRVASYDAERYPMQHATAQFHLGATLLQGGSPDEAAAALRVAVQLFEPLPVERAKARTMLGAALRALGAHAESAEVFSAAATAFDRNDLRREHGAAVYNLGLVRAQQGRADAAVECFRTALERFESERLLGQGAAAARELGGALLRAGRPRAAAEASQQAVELADRAGDTAGLGAAYNVLGLVRLGLGAPEQAVEAFRGAAAAHHRRLRSEGYAMAKANLALAYEQCGNATHAVLAARQALGVRPAPPQPVTVQATAVLDRLAQAEGATVVDVLDDEPGERWPGVLREEVQRWVDAERPQRLDALGGWIDAVLARKGTGPDLVYAWLDVLLELPPAPMETVIADALAALAARDEGARGRFRNHVSRAIIRFRGPQWMRLKDTFNRIASRRGEEPSWG